MSSWESFVGRILKASSLDSLRKKILVFAVGAALIPSLFTATVFYTQSQRALSKSLTEELRIASTQGARLIDLWLQESLLELKTFANSDEVASQARGAARITGYLASIQRRIPDYRALAVYDRSGRLLAATGPRGIRHAIPEEWLARLGNGEAVFGDQQPDSTGPAALRVGVPITVSGGRNNGAMVAIIELRTAAERLSQLPRRAPLRLTLLTGRGSAQVVDGSVAGADSGAYDGSALEALADTGQLARYVDPAGTEHVGAASQVSATGWRLAAEMPSNDAYKQISRLRNLSVALIVIMLTVVGVLAYLLGQLIVRPLDRLIAATAKVAGGDLAVDLPVTTGGEVGALTEVFNTMVVRLRDHRHELERLSITDALTGLFNRRHLEEVLATECERARRHGHPTALLLIDIDHFKQYNDTYGHLAGDEVLRRVAHLIQETVRTGDCVARYGGEEFIVVLPETALEGAVLLGERVRRRISLEPFHGRTVTLSVGVAQTPPASVMPEGLTAAADDALYRAKREGRDRVRA